MASKKIYAAVCGLLLSILPHVGSAQSLQEKLSKVEAARAEYESQMQGLQLYDKYINRDPIANISSQDLAAWGILIRSTNAQDIRLYCRAFPEQIKSATLLAEQRYCENSINTAFILTPPAQVLSVASALQKSPSGKCTIIDKKIGQFVGAVGNTSGADVATSYSAPDVRHLQASNGSPEQNLSMALTACCATEAKGGSCLDRLEKAFMSLK